MSKWKIIVLILIILIIGILAWVKLSDRLNNRLENNGPEIVTTNGKPAVTGASLTGEEEIDQQAAALVEILVGEYDETVSVAGSGGDEMDSLTKQTDSAIFNVDYYVE